MNPHDKPKLSIPEQIQHLKDCGVTFNNCSETRASEILSTKNNYFRLASFRVLFDKHRDGPLKGKYVDLDFGDLVVLSHYDQHLRSNIRSLSIDVEHYKKVALIDRVTNNDSEDGYSIVKDFVDWLQPDSRLRLIRGFEQRQRDTYSGKLISKYWSVTGASTPLWVFFEIISFGTLVTFCFFCSKRWSDRRLKGEYYMLLRARDARNAAAHGTCIMNGFSANNETDRSVANSLRSKLGQNEQTKKDWREYVTNGPMLDIVTLLWLYSNLVPTGDSRSTAIRRLNKLEHELEELVLTLGRESRPVTCMDFVFRARNAFGLV